MHRVVQIARTFSTKPNKENFLTGIDGDYKKMTVFQKKQISPDSYMLLLGYDKEKVLGVPVGRHMRIRFPENHAEARTFTPLNNLEIPGSCELLFKVYRPTPEFPNGGRMSQYLETLKPGDILTVSGPRGKHEYLGNGEFLFHRLGKSMRFSRVSFVSGGTGLTPLYSILMNLKHTDPTKFTLLYANKTEADILHRDKLEDWKKSLKTDTFRVAYTVEYPSPSWKGYLGRVNKTMLQEIGRAHV